EDDLMIQNIIREVLDYHYDIEFASDGEEALNLAQKNVPDILLLDIMMPKMDGFDVCKILRKDSKFNNTIIIMLTALSDKDSKSKGLKLGADEFLTKPFNPIDLRNKIKLMLRLKKRLLNNIN
ncbi:MAG: response regulator, partial [Bacteroidota bacterium]|nr:response regulator [Bacteroidota bacterium]